MPKKDYYQPGQLPDLAYLILIAVTKPRHGYLIMSEIQQITNGEFIIGSASLYTTLKKLMEAGFIQLLDCTEKKKTYLATETGLAAIRTEIEKRRRLIRYGEKALYAYMEEDDGTISI